MKTSDSNRVKCYTLHRRDIWNSKEQGVTVCTIVVPWPAQWGGPKKKNAIKCPFNVGYVHKL